MEKPAKCNPDKTTETARRISERRTALTAVSGIRELSELREAIRLKPKYLGPGAWLALASPEKKRNNRRVALINP